MFLNAFADKACGLVIPNIHYLLSSQSRGVSHLEDVPPLNALQKAMEKFTVSKLVSNAFI